MSLTFEQAVLASGNSAVEGWDCWRVSTLGLMHVGRSEGYSELYPLDANWRETVCFIH